MLIPSNEKCNFKILEAVVQRCSMKKIFLEISQNSQQNTCARVSVFSCEFCEISKVTFSYGTPSVAASEILRIFSC